MDLHTLVTTCDLVVAGTGSRSVANLDRFERARLRSDLAAHLEELSGQFGSLVGVSGGAEGWDALCAETFMECGVPYVLCLPNYGYLDYYWHQKSVTGSAQDPKWMVEGAEVVEFTVDVMNLPRRTLYHDGVHMNFWRNDRMVALADRFVVFDASSPGTQHCVRKIKAAGKPYEEFR